MSKSKRRKTGKRNTRLTIGYLTPHLYEHLGQWFGVADAAYKHDVNLISFPGWNLNNPESFQVQANVLYELVTADNVDGLVTWASSIGNYITVDELQAFHDHYRPLPIVGIGRTLKGIPSLLMDSYTGMREEIVHLIEVHGYRRLAFIRGPKNHFYAQERYRAYTETLEAYDIPFDPNLVTPPSVWGRGTGVDGARVLLDERKLRPQDDFEAIVGVSDDTLLGTLQGLRTRGIRVPADVAIAGFDDRLEGRMTTPPLTSVAAPFYEVGYQAVEMLLALMAGKKVPEEVTVPSRLVVRQSCGCESEIVAQAAADLPLAIDLVETTRQEFGAVLSTQREKILTGVTQAVQEYGVGLDSEMTGQLLDGFTAELGGEAPGAFLAALNEVLRQVADVGGASAGAHVAAMQNAVSALRRSALPHLGGEAFLQAEDLWQQARVLIGETAQRVQEHDLLRTERQIATLQEIGAALITAFDVTELADVLIERLPLLDVPGFYLSLYENTQPYEYPQPAPEWSRLVGGYGVMNDPPAAGDTESLPHPVKRFELPPGGLRFQSRQLVPQGMLPQGRLYNIIVRALYFRENQLGFALFETGRRQAAIYETLRAEISSALYGALLVQQTRNYAVRVQTAAEVSRAVSSILDPDELIQQVVELAQERFDLYYAGLFMVEGSGPAGESGGQWAMLQAGTGEAGRQMLARGHKLEIGGESMIGWCIANKQARIALDVGEDAVRFDNPFLPETRSELALPLVSLGEAIGALTIQSTEETAFSEEDVSVLQTMVDQLANAIANARLYDEARRERGLLQALLDNSPDYIFFKDRESRFIRTNKAHAQNLLGVSDPREVEGKTDFDLYPGEEENTQRFYDEEQELMETGEPVVGREWTVPSQATGEEVWLSEHKIPILGETEEAVGLVCIGRDITVRKQTEEALERRAVQLQAAAEVSEAVGSILDPDELIQQVVNLAQERFNLYYAGLFLVDQTGEWSGEPGRWAVLRAGTGEAGRQMLARGHKLEVDGESMIGGCITAKAARIALDVGEEAARFDNPFLPETRSELALPLVSRGEAIGALTIQSTEETAFSEEDVSVLQTMVDQLANAIANARLYDEARRERGLLQALLDNSPDYIFFKDRESRFIRTNKAHAQNLLGVSDPREVEGKTDFDLYPGEEENTQRFYDEEQELMETGEPVVGREWTVPSQATGEEVWLSEHKIPILGETGEAVGLIGIGRDITSLKVAELALERRALQLQTASEVSRAASSILDLDELIQQAVELVRERFELYYAGLFLLDEPGEWAVLRAGTGEAGRQMLEQRHRLEVGGGSMIGRCVAAKEAGIALDVGEEAVRFDNPFLPETRSELALPLVSRGEAIGALTIQSAQEAAFSDEDVTVLQTMADQLANAIANARLFDRAQAQADEMSILSELARTLSSRLSVQEVLDEVHQGASRLLDATNFYIALYDSRTHQISFPYDTTEEEGDKFLTLPADRGITGYIIRHRTSVLIEEDVAERLAEMGIEMVGEPALSWLGVPMMVGDQVLGVIGVQSFTTPRAYDEYDRELLTALAAQVASALTNARLFEQTQSALAEVEATQRRYLERAWGEYAQTRRVSGYEQIGADLVSLDEALLPEVRQAMREQRTIVLEEDDGTAVLVVPVTLRGQSLGAVGFKLEEEGRSWSPDDIALVEGVSEQFALAAENIRLLDETQRRAARERLTRDITEKMRRAASIDDVVQTAVDELFGALRTSRTFVRLGVTPSPQDDGGDKEGAQIKEVTSYD